MNQIKITNNAIFSIKETRRIQLTVSNISEITADQVMVGFFAGLELNKTNLLADGWQEQPQNTRIVEGQEIPLANHWEWLANSGQAPGGRYNVASIEISTNFHLPIIAAAFDVYASRSKRKVYGVYLKLE